MRRRRKPRESVNLLELAPLREVQWVQEEDGLVVLVRERPKIRGPKSFGRWISYMMAPPRIRLDELGSFAWLALDGGTTVGEIAHRVRERFGEAAEPVEQRLGQFVLILKRERFVSYPGLE